MSYRHVPAKHIVCPAAHPWMPASPIAGRHCTQRLGVKVPAPAAQYGVETPPSLPPVLPVQSVLTTHSTHAPAALQTGPPPASAHSVLVVQPATHMPPRQTGAAVVVQSVLLRQATHRPVAVSQTGMLDPVQALLLLAVH